MTKKEDLKRFLKITAANLHTIRIARQESLQIVAKKIKISPDLLETIEKGEYNMELVMLIDLCHYYNVKAADVISENFKYSNI